MTRTAPRGIGRRCAAISLALQCAAVFPLGFPLASTGAVITAEATVRSTENLSRTSAANAKDGVSLEAQGNAAWTRQLAPSVTASWSGDARLHATPEFELREHALIGTGGQLRYKHGLGPMAPTLSANGTVAARIARLDQDSGWQSALRLRTEKRWATMVRLGAEIEWTRHNADSATFDVSHRQISADVSWDISDQWRISHGRGRIEGSFTANAGSAIWAQAIGGQLTPTIARYYNSIPWEVTHLYGNGWVTYNVTGRAHFWWLEISRALGERSAMALRYERINARNLIGIEYAQSAWSLSLSHRF